MLGQSRAGTLILRARFFHFRFEDSRKGMHAFDSHPARATRQKCPGYSFGDAGPKVNRLAILPAGEKRMQSWPFTVTFPPGRKSTHMNKATS